MNISYNWLKQYINIDLPAAETAKILTSIGLEVGAVEEVETVKGGLQGLVVGEVLTCENHPNSDHLHLTTVNIGEGEPLKIVCGAPNCRTGLKVVVATIGTKLYQGEESFTIKRSKIRGEESFGMLCAEDEIGVGESHAGIIELPQDTPVGTLAKDYYNVQNDTLIEVDITPNRIDAASHFGVARDLAAFLSQKDKTVKLAAPSVENFKIDNHDLPVKLTVENTAACPRYSGVAIAGVTVKESPAWLQNFLKTIGLRPINNVVDVTNYVLHSLGQPLHAFDLDKIADKHVIVKNLPEGTKFTTLDGTERTLSADDLMICSAEGGMCIGGVFGGLDSGVTESTQNIFLESAYFNPVSIRKTARRHGLNTDASFRYERGCDPNNTLYILKYAALLIQEVAGGTISSEILDSYPQKIEPKKVAVTYKKINTLIGKEISAAEIKSILEALEMDIISENADELTLSIPTYRVDVQQDVDVIEDILRIYGYNNVLPGDEVKSSLSYSVKPDSHRLQQIIAEQLTAAGFNEIMNNSLTKSAYYEGLTTFPIEEAVKIINPLSADLSVMRQSLLFGGLESIAYNVNRRNADLKFYEFGNTSRFTTDKRDENPLNAYSEELHLALWTTGNKTAASWVRKEEKTTIYELKAQVENVLRRLGFGNLVFGEYTDELLSEAQTIHTRGGKQLGVFGIVSKKQLKAFDIENEVFYADFTWNALLKEARKHKTTFADIPKYPEVKRDLSLLLDQSVEFAQIEKIAYETERKLLKEVTLFDVYQGKNLESGKKSYAVSFILQDDTQTLTDSRIDGIMNKLIGNLETRLGAKIR
ncbi:phenylalanine--tRNA ligase beta subunit [Bacteroidia bacterium]|nr:phenylalanine--tRNA ligase beta subunit [Bacteroidia bacterium]